MIDMVFQDVLDSTGATVLSGSGGDGAAARRKLRGVSTDTRTLLAGELYLALSGPHFDGNAFVAKALEGGAGGLLLREDDGLEGLGNLPVPVAVHRAPRRALADLARWHRSRMEAPVIGITGSCGKTSTKELLVQLLAPFRRVHGSPASFNNDIGVPRTLLGADQAIEALVVEMGTNARGEIASLCRTARPTAGILTHIGPAHLEGLGTVEGVAREKSALIASLPPDGFCVLNGDCRFTPAVMELTEARAIRFALNCAGQGAEIWADEVWFHEAGATFQLGAAEELGLGGSAEVTVPILGLHMVQNLLAALAACAGIGIPLAELLPHLGKLTGARRRLERREAGGLTVYDDCYNANPSSAEASVRVLQGLHGHGRRVLILGDMLELGDTAAELHAQVGEAAGRAGLDLVVAVGDFAGDVARGVKAGGGKHGPKVVKIKSAESACKRVPGLVERGDVVMVKASRGARLERLVDRLLDESLNAAAGR